MHMDMDLCRALLTLKTLRGASSGGQRVQALGTSERQNREEQGADTRAHLSPAKRQTSNDASGGRLAAALLRRQVLRRRLR